MNDNEITNELLAEVPQPGTNYWQNIDAALSNAALDTAGQQSDDPHAVPPSPNSAHAEGGAADTSHRAFDITVDTSNSFSRPTNMTHTFEEVTPLTVPKTRRRVLAVPLMIAASLLLLGAWLAGTTVFVTDPTETVSSMTTSEFDPFPDIPGPRQNLDHWHAIYGVWDCTANNGSGDWVPKFSSHRDEWGIHSHDDGIIHIHPFFEESAGKNATFRLFAETMGISVSNTEITLDDGRALTEGVLCNGEPAQIELRRWAFDFQALSNPDDPDRIVTLNINDQRFLNDREVWVLAFAPSGADLELPPQSRFDTLNNVTAPVDYNEIPADPAPGYEFPPAVEIPFDPDASNWPTDPGQPIYVYEDGKLVPFDPESFDPLNPPERPPYVVEDGEVVPLGE